MKFKRLLAAILSALMLTSCLSFVAGAEEGVLEEEEAATYTVTLNKLNGDCVIAWSADKGIHVKTNNTIATATVNAGESFTIPTVTRVRANLLGWATTKDGEKVYEPTATFTPESDITLYALWERGELATEALLSSKAKNIENGSADGGTATKLYDAVNNVVFFRYVDTSDSRTLHINRSGFKVNTAVGIPDAEGKLGSMYVVGAVRTSVPSTAPASFGFYQSWKDDATFGSFTGYGDKLTETNKWVKQTISKEFDEGRFGFQQLVYYPLGNFNLAANDETQYFDVAAYSLFENEASATAYDPIADSGLDYKIAFDLNYEGAPELTSAPTENPKREGLTFNGWSTDINAGSGEMDLTALTTIPSGDTTYYAIWDTASITFNRRNGAKDAAVSSLNVALGEVIPFPENPTYQNHTFLGWSTEKNNKDKIVDTATAVVTDEMVENGMTYYAVWESTYDSTQPVFFVTAQHNAKTMVNENCVGEIRYDAENDIVYKHFSPNTSKLIAGSCNMYGLGNKSFTTDADKLYMVYYIRTNILGSKPYVGIYSTTNKDGTTTSAFTQTPNFTYTEELQDKWTKVIIELAGMSELGICTHIDFSAVGQSKTVTEANYYDISAIAIFDNQEAANNFDIVEASKIDNVTLTFNTHGGSAVEPITVKSGAFVQETIEVPVPTKENYTFKGWATELHGTVLASVTNPTADTTYYAVWEMADPEEASDKVYISTNGCDTCNNGFSAKHPVKTLAKAQTILAANSGINTIVVVDTYKKSDESGAAVDNFCNGLGRKIYITGLTADSLFDMRYFDASNSQKDSHFRIRTDVEFNNIKIFGSQKDGGIMSMGYELTFGENVVVNQSQNIGVLHYNAQYKDNAVVNILSGTYNKVDLAVQSGQTYKGTSTINIGGTAKTKITNGHGWKGVQSVYGINNVNINGGEVTSIQFSATADTAVTNYAGLRYFTINGGTVGDIYTTGSSVSKKFDNTYLTASARAGVTVFEINGGTVGKIKIGTNKQTGAADPDDATRVVILNNGMNATVEDTGAIVIKTSGGTLKAVTNAYGADGKPTYGTWDKVTADWGKAIKLTGYSYTTDASNKYIYVNGTNYLLSAFADEGEAALAEETTVILPADLFKAGQENTAIFAEAPLYTITWKNGEETVKEELVAEGTIPEAPVIEVYGKVLSWTPEIAAVTGDATYTAVWADSSVKEPNYIYSWADVWNWCDKGMNGKKEKVFDKVTDKLAVRLTQTNDSDFVRNYGETPTWNINNGKAYVAVILRTNVQKVPMIHAYGYTINDVAGTSRIIYEAKTATKGDYTWERVVIPVSTEGLENITKYQFCPVGWGGIDLYADIYGIAVFDDEYSANNWTFPDVKPDRTIKFSVDGTVTATAPATVSEKEHYTFKGWSLSENGEIANNIDFATLYASDYAEVKDYTYYAVYEAEKFEITFNAGEGAFSDASKEKKVQADYDTIPAAPETPVLEGYEFKGWTPELVKVTGTATYTAVFEEIVEEPFPTTPTYKTYGTYNAASGTYTVELKLSGTKANLGSFGFEFPDEYMTLTNVTANAAAGVALLPEEATEAAQLSPIFVKDTENGYYANTWTAELAEGYGYVDATQNEVLIATFTFTVTAQQRTAFEAVLKTGNYKFDEYVVANADAKYYKDGNYLVAPYVDDLSTNKEAVVYASHKDEVAEVEATSINLKVYFIDDKGSEGVNLATVRVDDGEAIAIETAGNTESANYTIENLTVGQTYKIYVEKNGYIAGICEVTAAAGTNTLEMTLIPGDIKGAADAKCGDGNVNLDDFVRLIRAFDPASSDDFKANVDINEDGSVTVSDLGYIKSNYNSSYGDVVITFNGEAVTPGITV